MDSRRTPEVVDVLVFFQVIGLTENLRLELRRGSNSGISEDESYSVLYQIRELVQVDSTWDMREDSRRARAFGTISSVLFGVGLLGGVILGVLIRFYWGIIVGFLAVLGVVGHFCLAQPLAKASEQALRSTALELFHSGGLAQLSSKFPSLQLDLVKPAGKQDRIYIRLRKKDLESALPVANFVAPSDEK